jgi:hypothetical protein
MPVVGQTVAARLLTHRRDKDAVGELQIANRERIEQVSHTNTVDWHIALGEFGLTENSATEIRRQITRGSLVCLRGFSAYRSALVVA